MHHSNYSYSISSPETSNMLSSFPFPIILPPYLSTGLFPYGKRSHLSSHLSKSEPLTFVLLPASHRASSIIHTLLGCLCVCHVGGCMSHAMWMLSMSLSRKTGRQSKSLQLCLKAERPNFLMDQCHYRSKGKKIGWQQRSTFKMKTNFLKHI